MNYKMALQSLTHYLMDMANDRSLILKWNGEETNIFRSDVVRVLDNLGLYRAQYKNLKSAFNPCADVWIDKSNGLVIGAGVDNSTYPVSVKVLAYSPAYCVLMGFDTITASPEEVQSKLQGIVKRADDVYKPDDLF